MTDEGNATAGSTILRNAIIELYGGLKNTKKHIGTVTEAYNHTEGMFADLIESAKQKLSLSLLSDVMNLLRANITDHLIDLATQVTAYKNSITSGHRVLIVAHSQGNFFAREAVKALPAWMRDYVEAVSIASPMDEDITPGAPSIGWDNDAVAAIGSRDTFPDDVHYGAGLAWRLDDQTALFGEYTRLYHGHGFGGQAHLDTLTLEALTVGLRYRF